MSGKEGTVSGILRQRLDAFAGAFDGQILPVGQAPPILPVSPVYASEAKQLPQLYWKKLFAGRPRSLKYSKGSYRRVTVSPRLISERLSRSAVASSIPEIPFIEQRLKTKEKTRASNFPDSFTRLTYNHRLSRS